MHATLYAYIKRIIIGTFLLVLVLVSINTAVRVYVVADAIQKAGTGQVLSDQRTILAAHWSQQYPLLRQQLLEVHSPARDVDFLRPSALELVLTGAPDWVANQILAVRMQKNAPTGAPAATVTAQPAPTGTTPTQAPAVNLASSTRQTPTTDASATLPTSSRQTNATYPSAQPVAEQPETPVFESEEKTAEPEYDPDAYWAVVTAPDASFYDQSGNRQGVLPAGSVLDIREFRPSSSGMLVLCHAHTPEGKQNHIFVREADLELYQGKTLEQSSMAERKYAFRYARIQAAITERKQQLANPANAGNPHQKPYHDLLRKYQDLRKESDRLQASYDDETGGQRVRTGERLHQIRADAAALVPEIRDLREKRDAWQDSREPATSPENDLQLQRLQRELRELEASAPSQ